MHKTPEVRINFSYLLYEVSKDLEKIHGSKDNPLATTEDCEKWTQDYREEWSKHSDIILSSLPDILGVRYYRDVIDVGLAPYFIPQSDPLIIHCGHNPDKFVDVLTHELIHVLLTDNNVMQINAHGDKTDLHAEWQSLFGKDHNFGSLVHIPVHAIHKAIYLDVLKDPKRYERDIATSQKNSKSHPDYINAWNYVNKHGYKDIIKQLKKSYEGMETE